jgi:SAM-dependent methyltransferase
MKIRESGMPPQDVWDLFFDTDGILDRLGLDGSVTDAVEFGCGYGTFTLPAAMLAIATRNAVNAGVSNIDFSLRDFVGEGTGLPDESVDFAMMFNILHLLDPVSLLREALRVLKSDGRLGIIHWNHDEETPRGPPLSIRPTAERCIEWAFAAGFSGASEILDLPPYHYGMVLRR